MLPTLRPPNPKRIHLPGPPRLRRSPTHLLPHNGVQQRALADIRAAQERDFRLDGGKWGCAELAGGPQLERGVPGWCEDLVCEGELAGCGWLGVPVVAEIGGCEVFENVLVRG